jgi:excisionase family DNA binding protein
MQLFSDEFEEYLGAIVERIISQKLDKYIQAHPNNIDGESKDETLKIEEAATVTGYKKGYIYILVKKRAIPFLKLENGTLRFKRKELQAWLAAGRPNIHQETIDNLATNYIVNGKRKIR